VRRGAIIPFLCLLLYAVPLQAQVNEPPVFTEVNQALQQPAQVVNFYLDCELENDSLFFASLSRFVNLKSLTIVGYSGDLFPQSLFTSGRFARLCLSECVDLNFSVFFRDLIACKSINTLTIDECNLTLIPPDLSELPALEKVVITNCDNLNLEQSVKNLSNCVKLKYLGLPVNQICEIPTNIGLLGKLEVLDISNNVLLDLPESMSLMTNLQTMNTEGNIFINPVDALARIGSLQIKYLSVDSNLSDTERNRLKQLFPNTVIEEKKANGESATITQTDPSVTTTSDSITYGSFRLVQGSNIIYSDAYLHYADIFGKGLPSFDSMMFDERYYDITYINVFKASNTPWLLRWNCPQLYLWSNKSTGLKGKSIAFNFYEPGQTYPSDTRVQLKELMAFRGMYWVYDGPLRLKEFKKKFIVKMPKKRVSAIGARDIRIHYDDLSETFTIEVKFASGYEKFSAHPMLESTTNAASSKEQYYKRYYRYLNMLDSRRKRFDKKLIRDKATFHKNFKRLFANTWAAFSQNYLSPQEKKMTPQEWLEYYDWVVGHEEEAFDGAPVTQGLISRYLAINKYIGNPMGLDVMFDSAANYQNVYFKDTAGTRLVVQSVYVLNTLQKIYSSVPGSLGVNPNRLLLETSSSVALLIFTRNGNVGVLSPSQYRKETWNSGLEHEVTVDYFDVRLLTFGQLKQVIGL
jgi:hypothetical protein